MFGTGLRGSQKIHREEHQSPHGRNGHSPFFNATILTATGGTPVLRRKGPPRLPIPMGATAAVGFHTLQREGPKFSAVTLGSRVRRRHVQNAPPSNNTTAVA